MRSLNQHSRWRALAAILLAGAGLIPCATRGQDDKLPGWDDDRNADLIQDLEKDMAKQVQDYDRLRLTHFSEVSRWQGVQADPPAKDAPPAPWKIVRHEPFPRRALISPVSEQPATTVVAVPEKAEYRVYVSYLADRGTPHPVTLTMAGANRQSHVFGAEGLGAESGKEQEKKRPIVFEDELHRMAVPSGPVFVWEYADMPLDPGTTTLELRSSDPDAKVDAVLLTASKSFRPSKSHLDPDGTIYRAFFRVRVLAGRETPKTCTVSGAGLGYHWRRIYRGETQPRWYGQIGAQDKAGFKSEAGSASVPAGEWTRWVNATEDVSDGPWAGGGGPWATGSFQFSGVQQGTAEVQVAWFPHAGAVMRTVKPAISQGAAICMIPLDAAMPPPVSGTNSPSGVWGIREPAVLARFETDADVQRRHLQWGQEALAALGAAEKNPSPKRIRLFSGCNPAPAAREAAQRMLQSLGINDLGIHDAKLLAEFGQEERFFIGANDSQYLCWTHDPLDPAAEGNFEAALRDMARRMGIQGRAQPPLVTVKMGDEIGAVVGPDSVNGLETCRRAFLDYLRAFLKAEGRDASFFGVEDVAELPYIDRLPPGAGLYERRLYYQCQRFQFVLTAMYYGQFTRAAERVFPRAQTYCNFSPHPPMFGQHMNGSDWFALTREGGASLAWGEDWASGGGWGFVGYEIVSYYGAWVECAARTRRLPAGFYIVGTMGAMDHKMLSLLARGIAFLHLYDWGPEYMGAEASNNWSERRETYREVARGARALGPADAILALGRREPRRAALLYNRTHEIWNEAYGGFQSDRALTFTALMHARVPTDIILEEDLAPETLAGYQVLYAQGFNLSPRRLAALRAWVEKGGVLVGIAGTAMRDADNTETGDAEALFGCRQRLAGCSDGGWHPQSLPAHKPIDTLTLTESDLTPAMSVDVIGVKAVLTPTTGKPAGTFRDGACGAVVNTLGKGRTLLLGVMPGHLYKGTAAGGSRYMLDRLPLIARPAQFARATSRVEYSEPQTETCLFEHEEGLAVTLNNFAYFLEPKDRPTVLTVRTDRAVKEAVSTLRGPLKWRREGDRIRVETSAPDSVDVVILR